MAKYVFPIVVLVGGVETGGRVWAGGSVSFLGYLDYKFGEPPESFLEHFQETPVHKQSTSSHRQIGGACHLHLHGVPSFGESIFLHRLTRVEAEEAWTSFKAQMEDFLSLTPPG